jgi:hypothetical protein
MLSLRSVVPVAFVAALSVPACSGAASPPSSDTCSTLDSCCNSLTFSVDKSTCSQQAAAARGQSDSQSACGALLSGYQSTGACGGNGTSGGFTYGTPDGGGSQNSGSSNGSGFSGSNGASLQVSSASNPSTVGGFTPSAGTFFFVVDFTLKNTGASAPLSTSSVMFSLDTSQQLVVSASADQPSSPCGAGVSIATGGQLECQIAFEVPMGQTPTQLVYDDHQGDQASASVPSVALPSASCEKLLGWAFHSPSSACMTCMQSAEQGTCKAQIDAYNSACTTCGSTCHSATDYCTCESGCDSTSCRSLFDAENACIVSACSASCP